MAKIRMSQVAGLPVRTLRRLVGIPAHRPTWVNACVRRALKGEHHPPAPAGAGGKNNKGWRQMFVRAVKDCVAGGKGAAKGGKRRRAAEEEE